MVGMRSSSARMRAFSSPLKSRSPSWNQAGRSPSRRLLLEGRVEAQDGELGVFDRVLDHLAVGARRPAGDAFDVEPADGLAAARPTCGFAVLQQHDGFALGQFAGGAEVRVADDLFGGVRVEHRGCRTGPGGTCRAAGGARTGRCAPR